MRLTIGGCRGTQPVARRDFWKYGGDTSAYLIEGAGGGRVIVDAGTGVGTLGAHLETNPRSRRLLMLFTHFHLDHIMGLPALGLLHDPRWQVTIAAPRHGPHAARQVLPRLLHPPFWPLQVEDLAADIRFQTLPARRSAAPWAVGRLRISWCPAPHPDGCTAYRIQEGRRAVVIAADLEWAAATPSGRRALTALCAEPFPASVLIMDGQYDASSYAAHAGWGHSAWEDGVALARAAAVERLLITHHAPNAADRALDRRARAVARAHPQATLARAGDVITC